MQDLSHAAELATLFKLDIKKKIKQMALGEKRKLAIIVAFMHNPDILVLDEPTSGLDPVMQRVFIEYILHQKKLKKTILLSSHIYSEVEALCDNVSIIKSGRIIERLNLKDIKIKTKKKFKIEFSDNEQYQEFVLKNTIFEYFSKTPEKNQIRVFVDDMDINTFNKMLIDYSIKYIAEDIETLEDHFMRFYKKEDVKIDGKSI